MIEEKTSCFFQFDDVRVEPRIPKIWKAGREVPLEPKTFRLLLFLIENRGRLVEKEELLRIVWKDTFVTENALTREIAKLRKALRDDPKQPKYIQTVHTRGYRFMPEVLTGEGEVEKLQAQAVGQSPGIGSNQEVNAEQQSRVEREKQTEILHALPRPNLRRILALTGGVAILLIGAVLIWNGLVKPAAHQFPGRAWTVQITTWTGLDIYPALSPDGNALAYTSDHNGSFQIYVKQLTSGGAELQLTSDGEGNFEPAWSPDGKLIAYYKKNRGGIWVMPALGGVSKQITEFGSRPVWSPDGSLIAFQSDGISDLNGTAFNSLPPSTIWVVSAHGGSPTQVTRTGSPPGGHGSPCWSPDGKRIVFSTYDLNFAELWSVSTSGNELKRVISAGAYDPVFSADGKSIYCSGPLESGWGLWRLPLSPSGDLEGKPVLMKDTGPLLYRHLNISADGKKIVCSAVWMMSNIWSVSISPESSEPAGTPTPVTQDTSFRKTNPFFSPDGRSIAFTVLRAGARRSISVISVDGNNRRELINDLPIYSLAGWLPEGDQVAFLTARQGRQMLVSVALETGKENDLAEAGRRMDFLQMSPDAKHLAFSSEQDGSVNIWTVPVEGGHLKQLTFDNGLMGFPCWSRDGQFIAFEMKRGEDTQIAVIPSGGGAPLQLTFDRGQSWPYSWSPDGDKIAFAGSRNGYWNVRWVSRSSKEQKQLTNYGKLNSFVRYPAWSPKGDRIVFEYGETAGNIWEIDLN